MKGLRLDRFLWFARFAKSRSIAQRMIGDGLVRIDGDRVTNSHHAVKVGQQITFTANQRIRAIKVASLPTRRGPAHEAQSCYIELVPLQVIDVAAV